jgi:hypothetical protein
MNNIFSLKRGCVNENKNPRKREGLNHSIYNAIQKNVSNLNFALKCMR